MCDGIALANVARCLAIGLAVGLFFLFVIGFSSPYWQESVKYNNLTETTSWRYNGLWKDCHRPENGEQTCYDNGGNIKDDRLIEVQCFEAIGIGFSIVTTVFSVLALCSECMGHEVFAARMLVASGVLSLITGVIILSGVGIYGDAYTLSLSWAFYFCDTAGAIYLPFGIGLLSFGFKRVFQRNNIENTCEVHYDQRNG